MGLASNRSFLSSSFSFAVGTSLSALRRDLRTTMMPRSLFQCAPVQVNIVMQLWEGKAVALIPRPCTSARRPYRCSSATAASCNALAPSSNISRPSSEPDASSRTAWRPRALRARRAALPCVSFDVQRMPAAPLSPVCVRRTEWSLVLGPRGPRSGTLGRAPPPQRSEDGGRIATRKRWGHPSKGILR
jgi:hypothetical protein